MKSEVKFIVDDSGRRTHVILPIELYEGLLRLEKLLKQSAAPDQDGGREVYFLKKGSLLAKGFVEGERTHPGFCLLKGSAIVLEAQQSLPQNVARLREKLIADKSLVLNPADSCYNLQSDLKLPSPTFAASLVTGSACNGILLWKNREGFSLKQSGYGFRQNARADSHKKRS